MTAAISTSQQICKTIEQTNTGPLGVANISSWRDKDPNIFRKVVCGAGLLISGLAGLVDTVASLALGILTYPLNLFGYEFIKTFFQRALFGGYVSGMAITISQFDNLVEKKLMKKIQDRLPFC